MVDKSIKVSVMDSAIIVNLMLQEGTHPDHFRIAYDLRDQMLGLNDGTNGAPEGGDQPTR